MINNIYVNCYFYGFYTSQENLKKYNLTAEKLTNSQQKINNFFYQRKKLNNFKKVVSLSKELKNLEKINITNGADNGADTYVVTEFINNNCSNISKKIVKQLYNYNFSKFYSIFF